MWTTLCECSISHFWGSEWDLSGLCFPEVCAGQLCPRRAAQWSTLKQRQPMFLEGLLASAAGVLSFLRGLHGF